MPAIMLQERASGSDAMVDFRKAAVGSNLNTHDKVRPGCRKQSEELGSVAIPMG
tara:strand:- start:631 stop:792 length:162 start_codon:yes stop_codon:yes gene_type:complete